MREQYAMVGLQGPTWVFLPVMAISLATFIRYRTRDTGIVAALIWAAVIFAPTFESTIFSIVVPGLAAGAVMSWKQPSLKRRIGLTATAVLFPLVALLACWQAYSSEKIVFTPDSVSYFQGDTVDIVPLKGLDVHSHGNGWTAFAEDGRLGPDISASQVFIGPDGFISGKNLATLLVRRAAAATADVAQKTGS